MAAYEDFEFFRTGSTSAPVATRSPESHVRRGQRDALVAELARLHGEVRRLRSHLHGRTWTSRLRRFVSKIVPQEADEVPVRESA